MQVDFNLAYQALARIVAALVMDLPRIVAAILIVSTSLLVGRVLRWGVLRAVRRRTNQHSGIQLAVGRLVYVAAIAVTTLVAATVAFPTFTVGSLIQLLGVSGVVIGFAFKDIFQNFLAGVLILLTNPFQLGDQIIVDTFEGTVEQIQTRATVIRTYDNRSVVVPNSDLFTKSVTVNTAYATRRMMYDLTLAAGADVATAERVVADVLTHGGITGVSEDPVADVLLLRIGSTTTLRLLWWSASERGEYLVVQDRVLTAVGSALAKAGVALA